MADPAATPAARLGTIDVVRLARGFAVSVTFTPPDGSPPQQLAKPDHFTRYAQALHYGRLVERNFGGHYQLVDQVRGTPRND